MSGRESEGKEVMFECYNARDRKCGNDGIGKCEVNIVQTARIKQRIVRGYDDEDEEEDVRVDVSFEYSVCDIDHD